MIPSSAEWKRALATARAEGAAWIHRSRPRDRARAVGALVTTIVALCITSGFSVTVTLSDRAAVPRSVARSGGGGGAPRLLTHAGRVRRCVDLEALPENADVCGVVERVSPEGPVLYCLFEEPGALPVPLGATASVRVQRGVVAVFDPEDVLFEGDVQPMLEMDAPCADVPQARDRHARAIATSRQCASTVLEGAPAVCMQHLREVLLTGWTCPRATTTTVNAKA